jgi:two-component system response regulator YesN
MKVLIADDEVNICKLIKNLINWEELGLELVGFAENGEDSIEKINTLRPDIVITDIRMPGKNGLEIIKDCVERGLNINFIIISGHAEFDYAKQALKYGVNDFLLKPISRSELTDALARIRLSNKEKKYETGESLLRDTLPLSLYHRDFAGDSSIDSLNAALFFRFKPGFFMPAVIKLSAKPARDGHVKNIMDQLKIILERELSQLCYDMCVCAKSQSLLCVFNFPEERVNDFHIAMQYTFGILLNSTASFNYSLVMGTGAEVKGLKRLQASFLQAVCACESRLCLGGNRIISGAEMDTRLIDLSKITIAETNRQLKSAIETLDTDSFGQTLRAEFRRQMPDTKRFPYAAYPYIRKFAQSLIRDITGAHGSVLGNEDELLGVITSELADCQCLEDAERMIAARFIKLLDSMKEVSPDRKVIGIIKAYVEQNFSRHIRLEDAAQSVYLSAAYLGILFKKETGENFSDYLVRVRIEKAKEMLKDIRFNINEVAENVGYKDTRYFSRLFKSSVGVNPPQYRQMLPRGASHV